MQTPNAVARRNIGGQNFTWIDNDGDDAIVGTFADLPEAAEIPDFLGSGLKASISYHGGDGNDVVLSVVSANAPPTANAGGPYTVEESGTVAPNGLLSTDPDQPAGTLIYEWDFDYDGGTFFVDASGPNPTFSAAALDGPTSLAIALRVTDSFGLISVASTLLNVANVAPTPAIMGAPQSSPEGAPITLVASASDPSSADTARDHAAWSSRPPVALPPVRRTPHAAAHFVRAGRHRLENSRPKPSLSR